RLWNIGSGKLMRTFPALVGCVAISADGKAIAGSDGNNHVVVCEVATGRIVRRLEGLKRPPVKIAFSQDGKALAAADEAGGTAGGYAVVVWDLSTGALRCRPLDQAKGWATALAFSPDGKVLGVAAPYNVDLWDAHTGKHVEALDRRPCYAVAFDAS